MKLVSFKTSMPPPSANPAPHQPHDIAKQINADSSSEVLQLRLENSELRMRLEDSLSHTDESKSELLRLLEEQTTQTNLLQSKCDELAAGFVEIDKERRALRKSADDARQDSMHLVERTRAECEKRCEVLEKHIKMKEKEVEKLAERTREQERRIEAAVSEWHDRQAKVDELEGELEELILLVDKERDARKMAHEQHTKVMEEMRTKEEGLERRVQDLQHSLQEREADVANLQQEHEQALKKMSDLVEVQKADVVAQQRTMNELHRNEKFELTNTLQSQIDDKAKTIQLITSEMKQIQIMHNEKVAGLESSIRELKEHNRAIEMKYQESCESNAHLQCDLESMRSSQHIVQEEIKATKYFLEKENGDLVKELDETKAHLAIVKENLCNLQMQHTGLQCDFASLEDQHSDLNEKQSLLVGQMERMITDCDEKISQLSKQKSAIEQELKEEKILNNEVSIQLRELNAKILNDVSVLQREKGALEQDLQNLNAKYCAKENDLRDLHSRHEAMVSSHLGELESLKSKHAEEISVIEMRGADIVNDLEETIGVLEKALADNKLEGEQIVNRITLDKERVERSLHDKERKIMEQDSKIISLTAYAKERKEEVMLIKTELVQVRHTLESTQQEHNDSIAAMRNELESSHEVHQREMFDLKTIIDEVRLELSMAKERLASDDGELERAKATLSERTNLLRDMVNQTTAYQGDYERERARANTLEEAVSSYKRQLAEAREVGQQLEREIHDKDTHYCDAIRNERQQRKTMESEFESSRKLFEDLARRLDEMEKENSLLKDKVSRQGNYIGRLQEREKRERRSTALNTLAASGSSRSVRPSTAGSKDLNRGKSISSSHVDENLKPNLK